MPVLTDQQVSDYHRDGFVVVPKLLGQELTGSSPGTTLLYALADYAEIPALVSATLLYGYHLRTRLQVRSLVYLVLVNSQWVHLLWLTDEVVVRTFTAQTLLVWPALAAWTAILIDYLELPVILDVFVQLRRRISQALTPHPV